MIVQQHDALLDAKGRHGGKGSDSKDNAYAMQVKECFLFVWCGLLVC